MEKIEMRSARSDFERGIFKIHVPEEIEVLKASWRFDRETGRLLSSRWELKYRLWVSFPAGGGTPGKPKYNQRFLQVHQRTKADYLPE